MVAVGMSLLTLDDVGVTTLEAWVDQAIAYHRHQPGPVLAGRVAALLFARPSTRTRLAMESGFAKLGGHPVVLQFSELQVGRGESAEDTARVVGRMADVVAIRAPDHAWLAAFAAACAAPVVNALSDVGHPCQLLADMAVFRQHRGAIRGRRVAWLGDGNNVCQSYVRASRVFGFELVIACPEGYEPPNATNGHVSIVRDPEDAVRGASLVATDTWVSMGDVDPERRRRDLTPYRVTAQRMQLARPDALFLHCLPAYRGDEVEAAVIDGPQSVVWDQAAHRLTTHQVVFRALLDPARSG